MSKATTPPRSAGEILELARTHAADLAKLSREARRPRLSALRLADPVLHGVVIEELQRLQLGAKK